MEVAQETIVIDYGSGNLRSAAKALERAAREAGINTRITVTDDAAALDHADRIVLPGVGAFGDCAAGLRALPGMIDALERNVRERGKPFLGICVGMQLMADRGFAEESDIYYAAPAAENGGVRKFGVVNYDHDERHWKCLSEEKFGNFVHMGDLAAGVWQTYMNDASFQRMLLDQSPRQILSAPDV